MACVHGFFGPGIILGFFCLHFRFTNGPTCFQRMIVLTVQIALISLDD